ncbi:unnamed protein product, partial [Phaeothamnion confervicola]
MQRRRRYRHQAYESLSGSRFFFFLVSVPLLCSFATSLPPQPEEDSGEVAITQPASGSVVPWGSVEVRFEVPQSVLKLVSAPATLRFSTPTLGSVDLTEPWGDVLHVSNVIPGTHVLSIELLGNTATVKRLSTVVFEAVLSSEEIRSRQLFFSEDSNNIVEIRSGSNRILTEVAEVSASNKRAATAGAQAAGEETTAASASVCFIGPTTMDGQRTSWLTQIQHLPRDVFSLAYLSFSPGCEKPAAAADPVVRRLLELGVLFACRPIPDVNLDEARTDGFEPDSSRPWPPSEDELLAFVAEHVAAAGSAPPATVEPPWARRLWEFLVDNIAALRCDVAVFGNGRARLDALLTAAARRAMGPGGRVVMELPNLDPRPDLTVDAFVAPSRHTARHASVVAASTAAGAPVVVITPGVDADLLAPGVASPQCHPSCAPLPFSLHDADGDRGSGSGGGSGGTDDAPPKKDSPCDPTCFMVGFVGRLSPEKSPGLFLLAAAAVHEQWPSARFVVVGDGPLRAPLVAQAARLGITPLVHFAGQVHGTVELSRRLAAINVLVNPSQWEETFCLANVEAMAAGLPVVAFGLDGTGEYFLPGGRRNCVLVGEAAAAALAAAVVGLARDVDARRRIGAAARRTVLERFTVQHYVQRCVDFYIDLLKGSVARVEEA